MSDPGTISTADVATERSERPGPSPAVLAAAALGLLGVAVLGRLWQPAYNVSPLMAVAVCSGVLFLNPAVAAAVPVAALALSNAFLPGGGTYGSWAMAAVVFAAFAWPALLGPIVRRHRFWGPFGAALAGSLVFYLTTNLAHWWLGHDYPHTAAGLVECFVAALPFYRWMPVGDVAWTLALTAAASRLPAAAGSRAASRAL